MITKSNSGASTKRSPGYKILTVAVSAMLTVSASITVFAAADKINVVVTDGENSVSIRSNTKDPYSIVTQAGFELDGNETLDLEGFDADNGGTIAVNSVKLIKVNENGNISFYRDVMQPGEEIGNAEQNSSFDFFNDVRYFLKHAFTVTAVYDGKTKQVTTCGGTVGDIIDSLNIKIGEDDILFPSPDTSLTSKTKIVVKRVTYSERKETKAIPFETTVVTDQTLGMDEKIVVNEGKNGKKELSYLDKSVDGVVVLSTLTATETISEPVTRVERVSARHSNELSSYKNSSATISELETPSKIKFNKDGSPVGYKQLIVGKATAYSGGGLTATGKNVKPGYIAVDPKMIPYGSEVYVVSRDGAYIYGYCIAEDTGGFVKMGNTTIDLYMHDEDMCNDWGNRPVNIYVF
ncbi:MAG: G5 domain-containing protein [Clostridiales bacterium]|nr:G5 domain-containing protein [Clostridiales bacterium]